jgi:hypothetical protein
VLREKEKVDWFTDFISEGCQFIKKIPDKNYGFEDNGRKIHETFTEKETRSYLRSKSLLGTMPMIMAIHR